jgi:serine protease inhibitor
MGNVLRFPDTARRVGDDARRLPWETALIHTGMAELNRKLNGGDDDPANAAEIRARIVELREKLETVKQRMEQLKKDRWSREFLDAQHEQQQVAVVLNMLSPQVDQYEIRVANALWGEKAYPFDPEYVKTINTHYDSSGIFPVDFRHAFEAARLEINSWVERQTHNRIKDLIPSGALNKYTRLVLTNAIYFKGEWSVPFKEDHTEDRDFTLAAGTKTRTPIMYVPQLKVGRYGAFHGDGSYFNTPMRISRGQNLDGFYPKADGFAMIELPYKGDDLSMVVIAPNDPAGLLAIEEQLTPANLNQWIGQLKKRETHVYLPKFKMETESTLGDAKAAGTLQRMGMVRAFKDPRDRKTGAQFHGMTTSTNRMEQLYISKVFHKAFVDVNEKGTEAAAATAVIMRVPIGASGDLPFTPEFKADRPFIFLIREKSTGSVLFLGRMMTPVE